MVLLYCFLILTANMKRLLFLFSPASSCPHRTRARRIHAYLPYPRASGYLPQSVFCACLTIMRTPPPTAVWRRPGSRSKPSWKRLNNSVPVRGRASTPCTTGWSPFRDAGQLSREMCQHTGGLYDPTVYPLVDLCLTGQRRSSRGWNLPPPDEAYIKTFLRPGGHGRHPSGAGCSGGYANQAATPRATLSRASSTWAASQETDRLSGGRDTNTAIFPVVPGSACSKAPLLARRGRPGLQINSPRQHPGEPYAQVSIMDCSLSSR